MKKYAIYPSDAFDWNELFNDPDAGKYNAVRLLCVLYTAKYLSLPPQYKMNTTHCVRFVHFQTVDFPLCAFYLDLMEFYKPNYKVILTVRDDPEQWYTSVDRTIRQAEILFASRALRFINWMRGTDFITMRNLTYGHLIFDQPVGKTLMDPFQDKQQCLQKYEDWIDGVKKHVPKDKLLILNVKQGWEPLCDFLGVEAPDEPFPRSNETANMLKDVDQCKSLIFKFNCAVTTLVAGAAASGYFAYKKYFAGK